MTFYKLPDEDEQSSVSSSPKKSMLTMAYSGATSAQEQTVAQLRRQNKILAIALFMVLAIFAPTVIYLRKGTPTPMESISGSDVTRLEAMITEHSAVLKAFNHSIKAVNTRVDKEHSHRVRVIQEDRAVIAGHTSMLSDFNHTIQAVSHRVDEEHSDRVSAIAADQMMLAEHTGMFKAVNQTIQEVVAADQAKIADDAAMIKAVNNSVQAVNQRVDVERSDRLNALAAYRNNITGLGQQVDTIETKMQDGVCTYCISCGGKWPVYAGETEDKEKELKRHGSNCAGGFLQSKGEKTNKLCCAKA